MNQDQNKPEILLQFIKSTEAKQSRAKLRVFFGMSAGVGKTCAMLRAAHQAKSEGKDVVIGLVETHHRQETLDLIQDLEVLARKKTIYRNTELEEFDIDAALKRKPEIIIVDELAHTNIHGSRHYKRYQDVLELLDAGIDVYTAVNVQHIESRKEIIEKVTNIKIQETVPDSILDRADLIELIDISSVELLKRLKEGKIYLENKIEDAQRNFFREAPLNALREIALRLIAEHVDREVQEFTQVGEIEGPINVNDRLMVAISHSPYSEKLIRSARRIAFNLEAPWIAVNIDTGKELSTEDKNRLYKNIDLARKLGAQIINIVDDDIPQALARIAKQNNVTQLIIGKPSRSKLLDYLKGGPLLEKLIREVYEVDIHIIHNEHEKKIKKTKTEIQYFNSPLKHYLYSGVAISLIALLDLLSPMLSYESIGFIFLLAVLIISLSFNFGPTLFSAFISAIYWNLLFLTHIQSCHIQSGEKFMLNLAYFLVAISTGILTNKIRKQKKKLQEQNERTQLLYELLHYLASKTDLTEALNLIIKLLEKNFNGNFCIIQSKQNFLNTENILGLNCLTDDKELSVAKWTFEKQNMAGWSTDTLPSSRGLYLPLKTINRCLGVLVYIPTDSNSQLSHDSIAFLNTISSEIAMGIERNAIS